MKVGSIALNTFIFQLLTFITLCTSNEVGGNPFLKPNLF